MLVCVGAEMMLNDAWRCRYHIASGINQRNELCVLEDVSMTAAIILMENFEKGKIVSSPKNQRDFVRLLRKQENGYIRP